MREIKFRGTNHETGKFVYGSYARMLRGIRLYDAIISIENGELIEYYIHSNKTIGQFTGLTDKNGVEIYEGDVCIDHNGVGVVEYSEKKASFRINYKDGSAKWFIDYTLKGEAQSIQVIGNIHENHELKEQLHA